MAEQQSASYKIGVLLPLSGFAEVFGNKVKAGLEAAVHPGVDFVLEDDQCEPTKGLSAYHKFTSADGVRFFLGPACLQVTEAILPLLRKNQQVAMGLCTGLESVHARSGQRFFLPQYSAEDEARFNADAMWQAGVHRAVLILPEMVFTQAHEKAFRAAYRGTIVAAFTFPVTDLVQMQNVILKLSTLQFDGLYIPLVEPFLNRIMTRMAALGLHDKKVFSVFSVEMPEVLAAEGRFANGIFYSFPDIEGSEEAVVYFARRAAEIFSETIVNCRGKTDCVLAALNEHTDFHQGVRQVKIILKQIRDGRFEPALQSKPR